MSEFVLDDVPPPGEWRKAARCRKAPLSVFFPTRGDDVGQAKAICRGCPVLTDCHAYAMNYPDLHGVWAGLSERERKERRKRREWGPAA